MWLEQDCRIQDQRCRLGPQDHGKALGFYPKCDSSCWCWGRNEVVEHWNSLTHVFRRLLWLFVQELDGNGWTRGLWLQFIEEMVTVSTISLWLDIKIVSKKSHKSTDASGIDFALKSWKVIRRSVWTLQVRPEQGLTNFLKEPKNKNTVGFERCMVTCWMVQLSCYSSKAATDNVLMNECQCVPKKLYFQKQAASGLGLKAVIWWCLV